MPATNDNSYVGPLTADDLRPYQTWPDYDIEPWHMPHMAAMMPAGLDQQGRYKTRPLPAEACTEIGANDDNGPPATRAGLLLVLAPWLVAIASWVLFLFLKR